MFSIHRNIDRNFRLFRSFLAGRFPAGFREALFFLPSYSYFVIVHQGLSHSRKLSSDRPGCRNELTSIVQPSYRSFLYLRSSNDHVGAPNTEVRPRSPTCKEHPVECPRYASASTFVIGSPPSFSFLAGRALFARIGCTGNWRIHRPSPTPVSRMGFLPVTYLYQGDTRGSSFSTLRFLCLSGRGSLARTRNV